MIYGYYGAERTDVRSESKEYPGINTPQQLYRALTEVWCVDTCTPNLRDQWTRENMTQGQCTITAILVQDIFGGEIFGLRLLGGAVHGFNRINGDFIDLTSEQFGSKASSIRYDDKLPLSREELFSDPIKLQRYRLMSSRLKELTSK